MLVVTGKIGLTTSRGITMNGYKAFYKGKSIEVYAETSYKAQLAAAHSFKEKRSYDVIVSLCERDGQQVTHIATE